MSRARTFTLFTVFPLRVACATNVLKNFGRAGNGASKNLSVVGGGREENHTPFFARPISRASKNNLSTCSRNAEGHNFCYSFLYED